METDPPKPTIAFICEGLVTSVGGAERVLCDLASHLADTGHEVTIMTHEKSAGRPFFTVSPRVRIVPLRPTPDSYGALRRFLIEPVRDLGRDLFHVLRLHRLPGLAWLAWYDRQGAFRRRLQRHLIRHPCDVAIAFMPRAIVALGLARVPSPLARIASTHTTPARDFEGTDGDNANVATRTMYRRALSAFDRITVLLPEFQGWYPDNLRPRTIAIPNAVAARTRPARAADRKKLVLAVGRLLPVKGHDVLIDAWARIAADFPDWSVEIHGEGAERHALQNRISRYGASDSMRLMGLTRDTQSLYDHAAVLVHPSYVEGFSLVVAEALAAGLPAVGFADCPGVNSLIRHAENGLLIECPPDRSSRVTALADTLASLLRDADRRASLGQAGPDSVARLAPEKIMADWERLILDAAQARSER